MKSLHEIRGMAAAVSMGIIMIFLVPGCGVTTKKLDDAEKRINALTAQGMPDSMLTDARILLVQIKTSKKFGGGASPQRLYDSVMAILAKVEMTNASSASSLKPVADSLRKTFDARKHGLTGAQLKEADSLINDVDAVMKQNRWAEAKEKCVMIDTMLNGLNKDEKIMSEVKAKLPGTWIGILKTKDTDVKADFIEKKQFTFSANGKVDIIEERSGQTNEVLKEDWKFQSGGTYTLKGDTILIAINKEKCLKQAYMNLMEKKGKTQWVKTEKPAYDSTITSGKKDRFVTFGFIKDNFKKK